MLNAVVLSTCATVLIRRGVAISPPREKKVLGQRQPPPHILESDTSTTQFNTMARSAAKRKVSEPELSEDEFDGVLEGVLSQSEDEGDFDDSDGEPDLDHGSSDELPEDDPDEDEDEDADPEENEVDNKERPFRVVTDANGGVRYEYEEIDPVYDSDDSDAQGPTNTIGNIPLSFYDSYPHIGYDINGKKIMRPATGEALDALLDSIELPKGWTGLTDPETGKPLNLSQDELELLRKLQMNEVPEEGYDPYPVRCMPAYLPL